MKENRIEIGGRTLTIPNDFLRLESMPDDPAGSVAYGMQNEGTVCYVLMYPDDSSRAMPLDINQISEGVHAQLGEKQGLIDIQTITADDGRKYVYTIVKTLRESSEMQYNLTLQISDLEQMIHVQGYFEERGTTGQRAAVVHEDAVRKNLVQAGSFEGWFEDPFDKAYRKGVLKNLSENEEYDAAFPDHPLSILRRFANTIQGIQSGTTVDAAADAAASKDQRKKLDQVIGEKANTLEKRLDEIRRLIVEKKPEEAKPLMDALAKEADDNPMFREDEVSMFFRFREWFEECLYRHMYEPQKDLRRAQYPFDEIYSLQGSMYIDLKDLDKARECLQKALSWNPVNAQIAFEYAETFKMSGDMERFLEETKKIQKFALHCRDVARFLRNTGFYFTEIGKHREAMMCFMRSLLYDRDSKSAETEINYLHQGFGTEIFMPDADACRAFEKQYGIALGPDNDLLGMLYAYGKHFMDEKQEDGAAYCFSILYELTDDPEIKELLEQLGVKVDEDEQSVSNQETEGSNGQPDLLYLKNNKADAKGRLTDQGFVVFAGSRLYATPTKSCPEAIRALRKQYAKYIDADMILQKDLTFTSASKAASFVLFASTNGLASWTDAAGTPLKALQGQEA